MNLKNIIRSARCQKQVDLLLTNARIVNVFSGEIFSGDIAVADGYIVGFGTYDAKNKVDIGERFVAPGRKADLVVFSDLKSPYMETVYYGGVPVAENGTISPSMNVDTEQIDFSIPIATGRIRVIDIHTEPDNNRAKHSKSDDIGRQGRCRHLS